MKISIWGKVIKGKTRGKLLGFPTANIPLHKNIPEGVYASKASVNNRTYDAAVFIGSARTFDEKDIRLEAHILNFNRDIYGKRIKVTLLKRIRGNRKFKSGNELKTQIAKDLEIIRGFLFSAKTFN